MFRIASGQISEVVPELAGRIWSTASCVRVIVTGPDRGSRAAMAAAMAIRWSLQLSMVAT